MQAVHMMAGLLLFLDLLLCLQKTGCEDGWFGPQCQYKCRCTNNDCDNEGRCKIGDRCAKGWFGPACQYADVGFGSSAMKEATDGDDETCIGDATTRRIALSVVIMFTWLRVRFSTHSALNKIQLRVRLNASAIVCPISRNATVDTKTTDIYCPLENVIEGLLLFGPGAQFVCSVYVSGGRNIALKQRADQSSTHTEVSTLTGFQNWSFPAQLAVDGNRNQSFYAGRSCAQTRGVYPPAGLLYVTLARPRLISRVSIYNREDGFASNMVGFLLESFNEAETLNHMYKDTIAIPLSVYSVLIPNPVVSRLTIYAYGRDNVLNICELEIYGDSICETGSYGKECEKVCNCFDDETCFVATGGCTSGCAVGYWGEECSKICNLGEYGFDCQETCSQFCVKDNKGNHLCDHVSGECLYGCLLGHQPPTCGSECNPGTYGADCELACSKHCMESTIYMETSCNAINGTCLYGCDSGYMGATCAVSCSRNTYGKNCQQSCSRGCLPSNNTRYLVCDHLSGDCLNGCTKGFNGSHCDIRMARTVAVLRLPLGVSKAGLVAIIGISLIAGLLFVLLALYLCRRRIDRDDLEGSSE